MRYGFLKNSKDCVVGFVIHVVIQDNSTSASASARQVFLQMLYTS